MADRGLLRHLPGGKSRVDPDQPSEGPPLDLGEGFPAEARAAIEAGEEALIDLRESVHRWYLVGGACFMLRNVALSRSGANRPAGQRYNRVYATLSRAWPQLAKLDKATRSHAVWLYQNSELVLPWLATLPQNQRDRWTHPLTIRNHFEQRRRYSVPGKSAAFRPRSTNRRHHGWNRQSLKDLSREDLEILIAEQAATIAERDRTIAEMDEVITAKDREIAQLENDRAWEIAARRQLEGLVTPPGAVTVVRPDGGVTEVMHATTRESYEVTPDLQHGTLDYSHWAKALLQRARELSATELDWLIADNAHHLREYEQAYPGAGAALEARIRALMNDTRIPEQC